MIRQREQFNFFRGVPLIVILGSVGWFVIFKAMTWVVSR